jgi:hypothetical protein
MHLWCTPRWQIPIGGVGREVYQDRTEIQAIPRVAATLFRVGPIEDVDAGHSYDPPANTLWGLNGFPMPIDNIDRTFFLAALLENDGSDPAEVENRMVPVTAALPGLVAVAFARTDLNDQGRFDLFISNARQAMDGTVSAARLSFPDPDDQIGPTQVIRFSADDQRAALSHAVDKTVHFEDDDASYDLTFSLRLAGWQGWFMIHPETVFNQLTPVAAVSRRADQLDLFKVGFDGVVWTCWWHDDGGGWRAWFQIT